MENGTNAVEEEYHEAYDGLGNFQKSLIKLFGDLLFVSFYQLWSE